MKRLLSVFIDGLKPDSIEYMPFLNSFSHKARIETQLGYSVTCHANIYTGVWPDKHRLWLFWRKASQASPLAKVRHAKYLPFCNSLPVKLLLHRYATTSTRYTSFFGLPRIVHLPVRYWKYLDVDEKKMPYEEGYISKYPTLFDILREENVTFEVVGMVRSQREQSAMVEKHMFSPEAQWTYLFMGEVDHFSHMYCQDSKEAIVRLRLLDRLLEKKFSEYQKCVPEFSFVLFSDHGHIPVKTRIDIYSLVRKAGIDLNKFFHIVDTNYLRIWLEDDSDRHLMEKILVENLPGFLLTPELLRQYHLPCDRDIIGDITFYLDAPCIFPRTIWGYSRGINSMHGYLPGYRDSDGVFVSNLPIKSNKLRLIDILPSHLKLLGMPVPVHVQGESVWKENGKIHNS